MRTNGMTCHYLLVAVMLGGCAVEPDAPPGDDTGDAPADDQPPPEPTPPPEPAPTRTVILVPGTTITGDYFDEMAARLRADGFEPVVFEPPDLFTESLRIGARRIDRFVERVREERGVDRVHVVAECNGGVATRYWLTALGGADAVDEVVTFVSAHHGTVLSPIGEWVTGFDALADITPGSAFLADLNASPLPSGVKLTSIYSCWDEVIQPYETSRVEGATNVEFCDRYLGHFDGFWDPVVYDRILASLEGRGAAAPTHY
jgi:triacylglycerol lipase